MVWRKEYLDVALVPSGLLIMLGYHLHLIYRYLKFPHTTVIGHENHCRKAWVEKILQLQAKERGFAFTVINNTISASTFLASTSLTLSSLIGAWIGSSSNNVFRSTLIYGETSSSVMSIKYIGILICFLVAFGSFLQCITYYVHANFLFSIPNIDIPVTYVQKTLIRGGLFWSVGLRAIYFALTLLLWIFGPIPMFAASVITVMLLYLLDSNSTPLHQYEPANSHNLLFTTKIGKEITAVTSAVQHRERRSHEIGCRTSEGNSESSPTAARMLR